MEIKPVTQDTVDFCSRINAKGDVVGILDAHVEYSVLQDYHIFILGKMPYIYDDGVKCKTNLYAFVRHNVVKFL